MTIEDYARERGFHVDELTDHGLVIALPDEVPMSGAWVRIPYKHLTGEWHRKYRNLGHGDPKYWMPHGAQKHIYNPLGLGPNADVVWITEGEFDALALIALGYPAIGVPGVTGWNTTWNHLYSEATVIVMFDSDDAGQGAAPKVASQFKNGAQFTAYPDGIKDANDWLKIDRNGMAESLHNWAKGYGVLPG